MTEETPEPQPHPDQILGEAEAIINKAGESNELEAFLKAHNPNLVLAVFTLKKLLDTGFSLEIAERMVYYQWIKVYDSEYGGHYGEITDWLDPDDDDI